MCRPAQPDLRRRGPGRRARGRGTIYALDWEFAGHSDAAYDLAELIEHPSTRAIDDDPWLALLPGLGSTTARRAADSSPHAAPPPCAGFLVTSANRARRLPPPAFAYVFSDSLAAIVRWVDRSRHWAAGHLVKAVRAIPGVVVTIPSPLITLVWSAGC
ncbi:hypothetical protein AMES_6355 [Amycolatopsis mediterranei S699]|uniref:Uncharacterized protein n=1 Tax=Amycolatopsis mediterranei (strain U-32) TaxID=749927 RepID=A0A0H3DAY8_AMYMU|nr:hypothetical protein AMED_6448 [Amycolatopsis mediterranei U32]AFO79891.1 hypothetical protein AMES_6355 [Amycolatopsis mediterranei S699]AGT87019.1 hypothetical protein B737_6355 [Amycolatopsis mediterranei RB]KDU87126.1 hypothetical protein DV36_38055 [Amycolatopsis mediterranei]